MAVAHISFSDQTQHGRMIRRGLQQLEEGLDSINDVIAAMATMKDGDGSQAAHWTYATGKFNFPDDATTKAAYDELQSLAFKLNTNVSVTDVNAALLQAFNKFR